MPIAYWLAIEELKEFFVGLGRADAVNHSFGGVFDFLPGKGTSKELGGFETFAGKEEFFAPGAGT